MRPGQFAGYFRIDGEKGIAEIAAVKVDGRVFMLAYEGDPPAAVMRRVEEIDAFGTRKAVEQWLHE